MKCENCKNSGSYMFWHNFSNKDPITKFYCEKKRRVVKKSGYCEKWEDKK